MHQRQSSIFRRGRLGMTQLRPQWGPCANHCSRLPHVHCKNICSPITTSGGLECSTTFGDLILVWCFETPNIMQMNSRVSNHHYGVLKHHNEWQVLKLDDGDWNYQYGILKNYLGVSKHQLLVIQKENTLAWCFESPMSTYTLVVRLELRTSGSQDICLISELNCGMIIRHAKCWDYTNIRTTKSGVSKPQKCCFKTPASPTSNCGVLKKPTFGVETPS